MKYIHHAIKLIATMTVIALSMLFIIESKSLKNDNPQTTDHAKEQMHSRSEKDVPESNKKTVLIETNSHATFSSDVTVNGDINGITATFSNMTVSGSATISSLSCDTLRAAKVEAKVIETTQLSSPTGTIIINGDLKLVGSTGASKSHKDALSFIQIREETATNEWKLHRMETFEQDDLKYEEVTQWMPATNLKTCHAGGNTYLQGPCVSSGSTVLSRSWYSLPKHTKLRVSGRVHFIDTWSGESVYLSTGTTTTTAGDDDDATTMKHIIWADNAFTSAIPGMSLDVCGLRSPDARISVPFDVSFTHTEASLELSFASTLTNIDCDASYGVDDLAIYIM